LKSINISIVIVGENSVVYIKELQTSSECPQVFSFSRGKCIPYYSCVS